MSYRTITEQRHGRATEVLVLEDTPTPPPGSHAAHSNAAGHRRQGNGHQAGANSHSYAYSSHAGPSATANGSNRLNGLPATGSSHHAAYAAAAGHSSHHHANGDAGTSRKRKMDANDAPQPSAVKNGKRKLVDHDTNDRSHPSKKAHLAIDDKEGHLIIRPNDLLANRYKIKKLLGQGTFGKVVQCRDLNENKDVAVKVIRAIQKYREASRVEIRVLRLLKDHDAENKNKCIHLVRTFDHENHVCLVSELLSDSVFDFLKANQYNPFPFSQIQHFAKQLLTSVEYLHSLRLVHTDLKPENILLVNAESDEHPSKRSATKTRKVLRDSSIRLIDFGSATFEHEYHATVVSTRHYRAPEIILGLGWSYPCDVWSIGCILVEFYTGEALFQTHENLEHLAMMERVFGPMPPQMMRDSIKAKPDNEFFVPAKNGYRVHFPNEKTPKGSLKFVRGMRQLKDVVPPSRLESQRFLSLLTKLLVWDPAQRYTVRQALQHPFFSLKIEDEGSAATLRDA